MNKLKYISISLVLVALTGCENFLERSPISNANEVEFYQTEEDIEVALYAAYNTLYTIYDPTSLPSFFGELMSDNVKNESTSGNVRDYEAFDTHVGMDTSNTLVYDFWYNYYESLYIINNILVKSAEIESDNIAALQGEARFLRALYYFDMVRAWGDVPLVLTTISADEAMEQGRTPQDEVYEAIIQDLQYAISNLPDKANERFSGAATSDAAHALLGKVYLTLGRNSEAASTLLNIYGKFQLEADYADLWDLNNKNCEESIFEIQYEGGAGNPYSLYWAMFTPVENHVVTSWGGGLNQVTDDLWNAYETDDPRRDISIADGYTAQDGTHVSTRYCIKWRDESASLDGAREASDNNFIILRYADVLLMLTEATGNAQYMNEVRARVGLPLYGEAGYPSDLYGTVELACEHERQVELAMEFHRWFDLIRTGRAIEVLQNSSKNVTITEAELLLPIPLDVITQNPDVMTQNEAYR